MHVYYVYYIYYYYYYLTCLVVYRTTAYSKVFFKKNIIKSFRVFPKISDENDWLYNNCYQNIYKDIKKYIFILINFCL